MSNPSSTNPSSKEHRTKQLYPECVASGSLAAALCSVIENLSSDLVATGSIDLSETSHPFTLARANRGSRSMQLNASEEERRFTLELRHSEFPVAIGESSDLVAVAAAIDLWMSLDVTSLIEFRERFPWIKRKRRPNPHIFESEKERSWYYFQEWAYERDADLALLVARAAREPRLRELHPFHSHLFLTFSRYADRPNNSTEGIPWIVPGPEPEWIVAVNERQFPPELRTYPNPIGKKFAVVINLGEPNSQSLGHGDVDYVVKLVVEHLPKDTGSARPGTKDDDPTNPDLRR